MTDPSAIARLAAYFSTTPIVIGLWICAIAVLTIVVIGYGCVRLSTTPAPEGKER